jgi:hypothetical protein
MGWRNEVVPAGQVLERSIVSFETVAGMQEEEFSPLGACSADFHFNVCDTNLRAIQDDALLHRPIRFTRFRISESRQRRLSGLPMFAIAAFGEHAFSVLLLRPRLRSGDRQVNGIRGSVAPPKSAAEGAFSRGGARIDIGRRGRECEKVGSRWLWSSPESKWCNLAGSFT